MIHEPCSTVVNFIQLHSSWVRMTYVSQGFSTFAINFIYNSTSTLNQPRFIKGETTILWALHKLVCNILWQLGSNIYFTVDFRCSNKRYSCELESIIRFVQIRRQNKKKKCIFGFLSLKFCRKVFVRPFMKRGMNNEHGCQPTLFLTSNSFSFFLPLFTRIQSLNFPHLSIIIWIE